MRKKLLLFDIDGTLVKTNGVAGKIMVQAIESEVGQPIHATRDVYLGSTDRLIVKTLLARNGVEVENLDAATDRILRLYSEQVRSALAYPGPITVLPGVFELLERTLAGGRFALGLVTGNIQAGAQAKLAPAKLYRYFPIGAFGDDDIERDRLPPIAVQRAQAHYGAVFSPQDTWIIGDTPKDIRCAKVNQLRCLAVASGWINRQELGDHQPDAVLDHLEDTQCVLDILQG